LEPYRPPLKACSYKPGTRRGAGSPPEAEGRREQPDEDGKGLRIGEEQVCVILWNFGLNSLSTP
jgi:hypothetical protein